LFKVKTDFLAAKSTCFYSIIGASFIPDYWEYPLIHYHQKYDWDCGISCILMVLSRQERTHFIANFDTICAEEGFGQR
jgi:hypothetical protein